MGFRDNKLAREEREKAELRERLERERKQREQWELDEAEEKFLKEVHSRSWGDKLHENMGGVGTVLAMPFVVLKNMFLGIAEFFTPQHSHAFRARSDYGTSVFKVAVAFVIVAAILGLAIKHEFYDIRDGYVTDKSYTPGYWTETCTGSGNERRCTDSYHPPEWKVYITFRNDGAWWSVSHSEYNQIQYGEWYCARDFLHEAPCVRDRPAHV